MKTCPICSARCFDDMDICFGCMHHFTIRASKQEKLETEVRVPLKAQKLPPSFTHKGAPRHAAPLIIELPSAQPEEKNSLVKARYELVISLEPLKNL